jgi:adenylosuccinate synthase
MSKATIVVGLGFGDEGKGGVVDFLARHHPCATVVRHNGGAQALHHVVSTAGVHGFAQFGSGSFVPTTRTHLSRFMLVNPLNMLPEAEHLRVLGVTDIFERTTVDPRAQIITPYHRSLNRLRELSRGADRHGSCGQGIGEAVSDRLIRGDDVPLMGDFSRPAMLIEKLRATQETCARAGYELEVPDETTVGRELVALEVSPLEVFGALARVPTLKHAHDEALAGDLIFEGAQGVLLDEDYGFTPHVTWSRTTDVNARTLLTEADYAGEIQCLGVIRSYLTRHGPGPFETEVANDRSWPQGRELLELPEEHNGHGVWQGAWRVGWLDTVVLNYAIEGCEHIDGLAMTHLDRVPAAGWPVRTAPNTSAFPIVTGESYGKTAAALLGLPLVISSYGQTAVSKRHHELETR